MKGISIFNFNCHEIVVSVMDVLVLAFYQGSAVPSDKERMDIIKC